jgi:hypothetical protein
MSHGASAPEYIASLESDLALCCFSALPRQLSVGDAATVGVAAIAASL